ncbi:unnamed protein product [Rotaria sordida]|uniref:HTH CENPB-type domain-containing protein n=1 Tax=Rotaria sordida TaxID=392033 RepID=A0A814SSZ2_9BILA|nr:unnamed protein product [Rotaria sordida]
MDGSVLNPLYMCLKEPLGRIGDNVKKNLFHAKNIVLPCSKSGKLTSSLVTYWVNQCLFTNLRSRTLLLVDSLPHQVHPEVYEDKLSYNSSSSISSDEEHVALNFYKCLESILESTSHTFETETILSHNDELDDQDLEGVFPFISTHDHLGSIKDTDYEFIDEHNLQNHFSFDYMKRVVDYYDEINPITEASGTRRQKLDNLDIYIFNQFEHIRHQYLSVHDIDLRRCGPKNARELNLNDFQASYGWLYNFKHRHTKYTVEK